MRRPNHKRDKPKTLASISEGTDLNLIAKDVKYVGSPEHKNTKSFAGWPKPRADASICDPNLANSQDEISEWLKSALLKGHIGNPWEGRFPRYVWAKKGDNYYEARLVNQGTGEYKGYPISEGQLPKGLKLDDE